jgi:predicted restriction endonuclease
MGRTIRHANRRQRRALRAIYRCCAFAGCDVVFERCEIHHILPWELGGPTDLINMVPLCSRHHHVVHDGGWQLELDTDRTLTIRQPDGQVFAVTRPDVPVRSPDPSSKRRTAA